MTQVVLGFWRSSSTSLLRRQVCPHSLSSHDPLCTLYSSRWKQSTTKKTSESAPTTLKPALEPLKSEPTFATTGMPAPPQIESTVYLQKLNRTVDNLTGVDEISVLKHAVAEASQTFDNATARVQEIRRQLDQQTTQYQQLSQQHADMMNRRHEWTESNVQEFARLTAAEGKARQHAHLSRELVREAEAHLHEAQNHYMDALRRRYHEEQVWNDKWRILGTYWTWALIALNSVVFVGGQFLYYRREEQRLMAIQNILQDFKDNNPMTTTMETTTRKQVEGSIVAAASAPDADTKETSETKTVSMVTLMDRRNKQAEGITKEAILLVADNDTKETSTSKFTKFPDRARRLWNNRDKLFSHLHWPSVALGTAATSLGVLIVSSFHRRS